MAVESFKGFLGSETNFGFIFLDPPFSAVGSFSEARFRGWRYKMPSTAPPMEVTRDILDVFSGVKEVLQYCVQNPTDSLEKKFSKDVQKAYQHWLDFTCVQDDVLLEINTKQWDNECEFNIFVARKILLPLSGGKCLVNGDHESALEKSKGKREAHLLLPWEFGWRGLAMGFKDAYYGEPDLIVIPEGQENAHTVFSSSFDEEEPKKKRPKMAEEKSAFLEKEDEETHDRQDSPGGKVVLKGKCRAKCATNVHELSQCFATAITFSSIQQRRHPTVHCFPTIRISPRGFDIILYNPEFDLLLICCLGWTRKALLILWIVEHYHLFPVTQAFLKENRMHPSGYLKLATAFNKLPKTPYGYGVHKTQLSASNEECSRDNRDVLTRLGQS